MVSSVIQKMFLSGDIAKHVSFVKVGTLIVAVAGVWLAPPVSIVKIILAIGGWMTACGARDAISK